MKIGYIVQVNCDPNNNSNNKSNNKYNKIIYEQIEIYLIQNE